MRLRRRSIGWSHGFAGVANTSNVKTASAQAPPTDPLGPVIFGIGTRMALLLAAKVTTANQRCAVRPWWCSLPPQHCFVPRNVAKMRPLTKPVPARATCGAATLRGKTAETSGSSGHPPPTVFIGASNRTLLTAPSGFQSQGPTIAEKHRAQETRLPRRDWAEDWRGVRPGVGLGVRGAESGVLLG